MLQRVQTVYMLAAAVAILMLLLFPLATFMLPDATYSMTALGLTSLTPEVPFDRMNWALLALVVVMMALPLVAIFMYRNRKRQLRVLIYTAVLYVVYYGFYFFECHHYATSLAAASTGAAQVAHNYVMLAMPALGVFCCVMAMRGVIFDEALVRSLERLR